MSATSHQFDLIINLARRNFFLQFRGSLLGLLWPLLLPIIQLMVFVFLFQRVVPLGIENYPAFVYTALLPWNWFSVSVLSAGNLFLAHRDLVRRPNFTPSTLAVVSALTNLLTYLVALPVVLVLLAISGRAITWTVLLLPLIMFIQAILIVGISLFIATWNVFYRDVQHIASVAVMLLFYLTPVFYSLNNVRREYRVPFTLNPMAGLVQAYRAVLYDGAVPDWDGLFVAGIIAIAAFGIGYLSYRREIQEVYDFL
jgi:ABC-type polysaccharide/polyol phosphate export permease